MRFRMLLLGYPLAEIAAAVAVARLLGWPLTIALVIAGVPIGWLVVKAQGRRALASLRDLVARGDLPNLHDAGGVFAGLLIMMPGFVTDVLGAVLLVPAIRRRVWPPQASVPSPDVIQGVVLRTESERTDLR